MRLGQVSPGNKVICVWLRGEAGGLEKENNFFLLYLYSIYPPSPHTHTHTHTHTNKTNDKRLALGRDEHELDVYYRIQARSPALVAKTSD